MKPIKINFGKHAGDPQAQVDYLRKLIFLAAHDIIFFSTYNEETGDWEDDHPVPCLNCSDTFGYACADSEHFRESDVDLIIEMWQKFGSDGLNAWSASQREYPPVIAPLRTLNYRRAVDYVKEKLGEREKE